VSNCKSFLVTEAKKGTCQAKRDFNDFETRAVINFFSLQAKAPKEIHAILKETSGEHAPSYATVKNRVVQFKRDDFSICDAPLPGLSKTVTTPEIIDQIHDLGFRLNQ